MCARFSERHSHTASIHHSSSSDHSVELHVGMAADERRNLEWFKERQEAVFSRQPGEDLRFAARRTVAEQYLAQAVNLKLERFRPTGEHRLEFGLNLCGSPAIDFDDTFWGTRA